MSFLDVTRVTYYKYRYLKELRRVTSFGHRSPWYVACATIAAQKPHVGGGNDDALPDARRVKQQDTGGGLDQDARLVIKPGRATGRVHLATLSAFSYTHDPCLSMLVCVSEVEWLPHLGRHLSSAEHRAVRQGGLVCLQHRSLLHGEPRQVTQFVQPQLHQRMPVDIRRAFFEAVRFLLHRTEDARE